MSVLIYHGCLHQSKAALAPGECSFLVTLMVAEGGEKGEYFMKPTETPFFLFLLRNLYWLQNALIYLRAQELRALSHPTRLTYNFLFYNAQLKITCTLLTSKQKRSNLHLIKI